MLKSNTTSFLPKNTETQQENTKENTKKITEINWDWWKKISWLKKVRACENELEMWANLVTLKKSLIKCNLYILHAAKAWQTIPAGSLKKQEASKIMQKTN